MNSLGNPSFLTAKYNILLKTKNEFQIVPYKLKYTPGRQTRSINNTLQYSVQQQKMMGTSNDEWVQITPHIAFQTKVDPKNSNQKMIRAETLAIERLLLSGETETDNCAAPVSTSPFVVGYENINQDWHSEQLAWHLLGFYIDCGYSEEEHREEGHRDEHHKDGNHRRLDGVYMSCKRKVMYAVYVDPNYRGGGLGEYKYYNAAKGEYTCYNGGSCRSKMDCHSADTETWKLIGVFKIDRLSKGDGWMEQLFKHAGVCYWGWDNYAIAAEMRKALPTECKQTEYMHNDTYLYSDVKPTLNGGISMGLYTDNLCSNLFVQGSGTYYDPFSVIGKKESDFDTFNTLLNDYKICQPCISYDLSSNDFTCADDAGYTNCNQCMKFAIKAKSSIATPAEIKLAFMQQSMPTNGKLNVTSLLSETSSKAQLKAGHQIPFYVTFSASFFVVSLILYLLPKRAKSPHDESNILNSPLSSGTDGTADMSFDDDDFSPKVIFEKVRKDSKKHEQREDSTQNSKSLRKKLIEEVRKRLKGFIPRRKQIIRS